MSISGMASIPEWEETSMSCGLIPNPPGHGTCWGMGTHLMPPKFVMKFVDLLALKFTC